MTDEQAMAIQLWIAEGVTRAVDELSETHAVDSSVEILDLRCCTLGDFGRDGLHTRDDDIIAAVSRSYHGPISGVTLLTMEPEDALGWACADGNRSDPVATYVELGGHVMEAVIEGAGRALGGESVLGPAKLMELSLAGCLIETHAPSDTVVVSSLLRLHAGGQVLDANLYLLLDTKHMSAILGALSISAN